MILHEKGGEKVKKRMKKLLQFGYITFILKTQVGQNGAK
ncbi:conserved hypothetical protein [uncultured Eubacteriales bacterium]|uniref:Uncharacterized protein n=1 Tax=uncultured Eubacteriales bacterium TaxID=172733 RepID=A0A212J8W9_9FIRM|nr:conserved hypothetical protein [uncultured Eubacteriales bacterium]